MRPRPKKLTSLRIRDLRHLQWHLGVSVRELMSICACPHAHYRRSSISKNGKTRHIAEPIGRLRLVLDRLNRLLQRIDTPETLQGGIRGRSNVGNAARFVGCECLVKTDIKDFFPNVRSARVYALFSGSLGCSPDVSRVLTRLTTLDGQLPQGSPTSTILAALVTMPLARRLMGLAEMHASTTSIYVDDVSFGGPRYVGKLRRTIETIVTQEGFETNAKTAIQFKSEEQLVTGGRVDSRLDVPSEKVREIRETLNTLENDRFHGRIPSARLIASVTGKIAYAKRLNPGLASHFTRRLRRIEASEAAQIRMPISL